MKITVERNVLSQVTNNLSRMVSAKSAIPALEGLLIAAEGENLTVTAYDLETGLIKSVPADISRNGSVVLSARTFADIVRKLDGEKVSLEVEGDKCIVACGNARFTLPYIEAAEFPEMPALDRQNDYTFTAEMFKSVVRQTVFSVAVTDIKPVHMGLMFDIEDEILTVVGVDGYRLAVRREKLAGVANNNFIIPARAVNEIIKLLGEGTEEVGLFVGSRHVCIEAGGYILISRLLDGEFLDYNRAIPKENKTRLCVNTRVIADTIDRVSPVVNERLKSPVKCTIKDNLFVACCSTPIGTAEDEFPVQIEGDEVEIGFNNRYMLDALKAAETDEIIMEFSGALNPVILKPTDGDSFLFLVLPVRLKNG